MRACTNTHTHVHTQAHSHEASTKKHNSTKVRVNESANRLHFPTLGSFSLLQKLNWKRLAVLSQGKGWERLPGPKYGGFFYWRAGRRAQDRGANSFPSPFTVCPGHDVMISFGEGRGEEPGWTEGRFLIPLLFFFMIWFLSGVWCWCKTVLRLKVWGPGGPFLQGLWSILSFP